MEEQRPAGYAGETGWLACCREAVSLDSHVCRSVSGDLAVDSRGQ